MKTLLRVLVIEDSEDDTQLELRQLRSGGYELKWERVETPEAMSSALDREQWDVILCDYRMPNFNAPAALKLLQEKGIDIPFIIVSGTVGEDAAVAAMKAGAQDYLMKNDLARLVVTVEREIREAKIRFEKKQSEKSLRESEEKFRLLSDQSLMAIGLIQDGVFKYVNKAYAEMSGYSEQEILGWNPYEYIRVIHPDDRKFVGEHIRLKQAGDENVVPHYEFRGLTKGGEVLYLDLYSRTVTYAGKPADLFTFVNITERKKAEVALRESDEKLRALFNTVGVGITVVDMTGNIVDVNDTVLQMTGYSHKEEVIGKSGFDFIAESDHSMAVKSMMDTIGKGSGIPIELTLLRKDGREFDGEASADVLRDSSGNPVGMVCVSRDITERKRAQEALQASEKKLHAVFNQTFQLAGLVTIDGILIEANNTALEFIGVESSSVLNKPFWTTPWWTHSPELQEKLRQAVGKAARGESIRFEATHVSKHGELHYFDFSLKPVVDESGKVLYLIPESRDITERKLAEEALRDSQEKYSTLVEKATDGVTIIQNKLIKFANRRMSEMSGYTIEELTGLSTFDLVPSDFRITLAKRFAERARGADLSDMFYTQMLCKDGTVKEMESSTRLIQYEGKTASLSITRDITERKRMEEQLHREEQRFRILAEQSSDIIVLVNPEGAITYENPAIESVLGLKAEERLGSNVFERIHPDDLKLVTDAFNTLARNKNAPVQRSELRIRHMDGSWHTFEAVGSNLVNNNIVEAVIINLRDITERKQTEEKLLRISKAVESSSDAIGMSDAQGHHFYHNKAFTDMFEYTAEELEAAGGGPAAFSDKDIASELFDTIMGGVAWSGEIEMVSKSGRRFPVLIRADAIKDEGGKIIGLIGVHTDITERKQAQDKLRESNEKIRSIFDAIGDSVTVVDMNSKIVELNESAVRLFGVKSKEAAIGMDGLAFVAAEDLTAVTSQMGDVLLTGKAMQLEQFKYKRLDGTIFYGETSSVVLHGAQGNVVGLIGVIRDVTERRRLGEALQISEMRYRRLFESAKDGILILDAKTGMVMDVNPFLIEMLGFSHEQFLGKAIWELGFFKDVIASEENFVELQRQEYIRYDDLPLQTADGRRVNVEFVSNVYLVDNKEVIQCNIRDVTERKKMEAALKKSSQLLRDAGEMAKVGGWELDVETLELIWAEEVYRIHEVDMTYKPTVSKAADFYVPASRPIIEQAVQHAIEHGEPFDMELELITAKGNLRWVHEIGKIDQEHGKVIGTIQDITERKSAEEALNISELRYRRLFESAKDGILILDADTGMVVDVNPFLVELLGYSYELFMGKSIWDLGVFKDVIASKEKFLELQQKEYVRYEDLPLETADRRRIEVEFVSNVYLVDKRKVVQCNIRNITEHKRELRESEERYRLIADNASDIIWTVDKNLKYTYISPSVTRMRGYSVEEAMDQPLEESLPPSSLEMVKRVTAEDIAKNEEGQVDPDRSFTVELELNCKDGSTVWVENMVGYLRDPAGRFIGYLGISRDITERRRLMKELNEVQQEQIRTKDRFISHVSHEFRSPLASIYQFATILLDGLAGDISPEQREYMEIVLRNVQQLRSMVDDLLEINRAAAGKLTIIPRYITPAELIKGVIETFCLSSTKAMHLSANIPGDLPPVLADSARVREVLINLLDNAMKFTPENGSIAVQAEIYSQDPNFLCVKVSDTGCGISHDEIEKIFDYLYQVESAIDSGRKGLGLGLYICKEIISRHGGRIWAESEPGYGSTFLFTLPIFSLSRLLAPIMTEENVAAGSIAIVTIEVFPVEKRALAKNDESALQEAWNAVSGCIFLSKDVLLPMMPSTEQGAVFCAVLWTDQRGAEAFVRRIDEHLERCQSLRNSGLNPATFISMLDMPAGTAQKPFKEIIKKIVAKVREQTKVAIAERGLE